MNGMPSATALDVERYEMVGIPPDPQEFPHASRWFLHIRALIARFPDRIDMERTSETAVGSAESAIVSAVEDTRAPSVQRGPRGGGTKLKVLALHGLGQCKETFQESQQLAENCKDCKDCLAAKLKHVVELVYVDAAHVDPRPGSSMLRVHYVPEGFELGDTFAWQTVEKTECNGAEESLAYLEDIWRNHPDAPFDGVLGFSMGASMGACFVDHMQRQDFPGPRFFICCSGSYTPVPTNIEAYAAYMTSDKKIMTPSFHTIGKEDDICLPELSRKLASIFFEPQVLEFEKGKHRPPNRSSDCAHIIAFLNDFL
jgi:predicted esterase